MEAPPSPGNQTCGCKTVTCDAGVEKKEKDLKAKTEELHDLRAKLEHEQNDNQNSKKQAEDLQTSLDDLQHKLRRTGEAAEKLRQEVKRKTEQIEKLERNNSHLEDRIRNLEIRASEVEKAELSLELTRRNLEISQQEWRSREDDIRKLTDKYDNSCRELEQSKKKISELEQKIQDFKLQIKHTIVRNETIEKDLEAIPHLKDDIAERDKQIAQLQQDVQQKTLLLGASRKAVREYRDKIRELERCEADRQHMRTELELTCQEVTSLKYLLTGKDALLLRKGQALDQAKEIIEVLSKTAEETEMAKKMTEVINRLTTLHSATLALPAPHPPSKPEVDVSGSQVNGHQRSITLPNPRHAQVASRQLTADGESPGSRQRAGDQAGAWEQWPAGGRTGQRSEGCAARTAVVHPVRRSASLNDHAAAARGKPDTRPAASRSPRADGRVGAAMMHRPERRVGPRFQPLPEYPAGNAGQAEGRWVRTHSSAARGKAPPRPYSALVGAQCVTKDAGDADSSSWQDAESDSKVLARAQLTARQRDDTLAAALSVGDRVIFTVPQKPPRYGRKKLQAIVYTGLVKYVGHLDQETYDPSTHVGVRLDEPIGESDGTFKGRRYMFTPHRQAKFFKLTDLTSVLDVKSGQYLPASRLLLRHLKKSQSSDYDHPHATAMTTTAHTARQ